MQREGIVFHYDGHEDWVDAGGEPTYLGESWDAVGWLNIKVMVVEMTEDGREAWVEKYDEFECNKFRQQRKYR